MVLALSTWAPVLEDGQGALAEECRGTAGSGFAQLLDFPLRKGFRLPFGLTEALITCRWVIAMILKTMSSHRQANGIRIEVSMKEDGTNCAVSPCPPL